MKLLCPEVLHILRHKPVVILSGDHTPQVINSTDKERKRLIGPLLPLIHQAQKFIFDSGTDRDLRTVDAVKQTAVAMIDVGLFHQPHPLMWIEDPFHDEADHARNFYLTIEQDTEIFMWVFQIDDLDNRSHRRRVPAVIFAPYMCRISLTEAEDRFEIIGDADRQDGSLARALLQQAVYAYKKLIVTLNTEDLLHERVRAHHGKQAWNGDPRSRPYDHTIVRIPTEDDEGRLTLGSGLGGKRRRHLVAGFVWGKNTRPRDEQRWIKPYWRGDKQVGVKERTHYEIKA